MIRRNFLQLLAGVLSPAVCPNAARASTDKPGPGPLPSGYHETNPAWLSAWLRLPRLPVLWDDLGLIRNADQRALAAVILQRLHSGQPLGFCYMGGSEPGKNRWVLPVLLFTTADSLDVLTSPLYLLAWCQTRNAPRTFRLDCMLPPEC